MTAGNSALPMHEVVQDMITLWTEVESKTKARLWATYKLVFHISVDGQPQCWLCRPIVPQLRPDAQLHPASSHFLGNNYNGCASDEAYSAQGLFRDAMKSQAAVAHSCGMMLTVLIHQSFGLKVDIGGCCVL